MECKGLSQTDILKYAVDSGIINMSYVQEKIEMAKREEILEKHPYKIWEGNNGKWYTYLLGGENKRRRLVKKTTKEQIEDTIVEFYDNLNQDKKDEVTFKDMFMRWREVQKNLVASNTINKYDCDYKRFFYGKDFENIKIKDLTEENINVFIANTIRNQKLCKKTSKALYGYINGVVNSARINRIIQHNPMEFIRAKHFYKWCEEIPKPIEKRIVTDDEMENLLNKLHDSYKTKENHITVYAVEFASYTGMRVGELSALRWDSITPDYIIIDKSEKYDRINKEYYIDKTKNGKSRVFPITSSIKRLLSTLKKVEMKYGYLCEWVFANENGRIHARTISDCMRNKCEQAGISVKSIHALRRTLNSKMKCMGVSSTVAASLLGHTEEVNELNYTYDVTTIEEKRDIVKRLSENKLKIV